MRKPLLAYIQYRRWELCLFAALILIFALVGWLGGMETAVAGYTALLSSVCALCLAAMGARRFFVRHRQLNY